MLLARDVPKFIGSKVGRASHKAARRSMDVTLARGYRFSVSI